MRYLMRPVPVVLRPMALVDQLSATKGREAESRQYGKKKSETPGCWLNPIFSPVLLMHR